MSQYVSGETVNHIFKVRINGAEASGGQVTNVSGKLYVDGVYASATGVTTTSLGNGLYSARYTVPSSLAEGADLELMVDLTVNGIGRTVIFRDQQSSRMTNLGLYNYLVANPINVGLTTSARTTLVSAINTGGVTAEEIADAVLRTGVSTAISRSGALDRHSLGAVVLFASNADTTSNPGKITLRHPDTDAALFQYTITAGAGCPIQSVT